MSSDLTWQIIKNNSCFLKVRKNVPKKFSTDPMNVMGVNSQRFNGLVNKKAINVRPAADGKGIVVCTKILENVNTPGKAVKSVLIRSAARKSLNSVSGIVKNYKAVATMPVIRKASQILRSQKPRKIVKTEA